MAKDDIDPEDMEELEIDGEDDLDILEDDLDGDDPLLSDDDDDLDDDDSMGATIVRKATDDDEDEDDMVAPDDVEEDLAEILKDRLASEDLPAEEDEIAETDERTGADDALQPKRADETLCSTCFMLVRKNTTVCPMGDDECAMVAVAKKKEEVTNPLLFIHRAVWRKIHETVNDIKKQAPAAKMVGEFAVKHAANEASKSLKNLTDATSGTDKAADTDSTSGV